MINISQVDKMDVIIIDFPYDEDESITKRRPAIVLEKNEDLLELLVVKVTKTEPRENDDYDKKIIEWIKANLKLPSTARCSKLRNVKINEVHKKIGTLDETDFQNVVTLAIEYINSQK